MVKLQVELCDVRLKLKENADLVIRYLYNKNQENHRGSVIRELYDAKRSLSVDNVIAIVKNEHEALAAARRDLRRLLYRRFAELEARTVLNKGIE